MTSGPAKSGALGFSGISGDKDSQTSVKLRTAASYNNLVPTRQNPRQNAFLQLGLTSTMISRCKDLGISKPSPVQAYCIPAVLSGKNLVANSPTGTGKTLAFAIPIVQLSNLDPHPGFSLILTPTRELASQIADQFRSIVGNPLSIACVIGGMDFQEQSLELGTLPLHVIATPGRLADHLDNNKEETQTLFRNLKFLVIDEADRVLGGDFDEQLKEIMKHIPETGRQNLFFTATMTEELRLIAKAMSTKSAITKELIVYDYASDNPEDKVIDRTIKQYYVFCAPDYKDGYFMKVLSMVRENDLEVPVRSMIIFVPTCKDCNILGGMMKELEFPNVQLHSRMKQKERREALSAFKSRQITTLIATDVASRGLDIQTVDLVINYHVPFVIDYIHRIGRAGRTGQDGLSITFLSTRDIKLLHAIENKIEEKLSELKISEKKVLEILNEVNAAKRSVILRMTDDPIEERLATYKRKRELLHDLTSDDEEESEKSSIRYNTPKRPM